MNIEKINEVHETVKDPALTASLLVASLFDEDEE